VHHPKSATLAAYAAGALNEAKSAVVAAHLNFCEACRRAVSDFEALGGAILADAAPVPLPDDALERLWSRASASDEAPRPTPRNAGASGPFTASTLRFWLKDGVESVPWRRSAPGVSHHVLSRDRRGGLLWLLRTAPGTRIPKHTHKGAELTLVLGGAFEDAYGRFAAGDFADLDDEAAHEPLTVGDEPCICLVATDAPLVFKDLAAKFLQPFLRM
jgi:putative transcriptional regulator